MNEEVKGCLNCGHGPEYHTKVADAKTGSLCVQDACVCEGFKDGEGEKEGPEEPPKEVKTEDPLAAALGGGDGKED